MKEINLSAPINPLGYGVAGTNILASLANQGTVVNLWPIGPITCEKSVAPIAQKAIDNRHKYGPKAPSLRIWHDHDLAQHVGRGIHVGWPIFELDGFSNESKMEMMRMDQLFVCSRWAAEIVSEEIPTMNLNISIVPLGVNRDIFNENIAEPDSNWTTFLSVGKWEYRKGHDLIAEAFHKAFNPKDRVRLWMMCHNPFLSDQQEKEWEGMFKQGSMGHKVNFIPRQQDHSGVAKIMASSDCGLFPSRAEGWNLELLEMMSMGKQVITTDYSAHTEFANEDNSLLIPVDSKEDAFDGVFFKDDSVGQWGELGETQLDCMIAHMRRIHHSKKCVNTLGIETAERYSWRHAANLILNHKRLFPKKRG